MRRLNNTKAYKLITENKTFSNGIEFCVNDEMLKCNDANYSIAINQRKEKYKDEPWFDLLTSGALLKYIFLMMVYTLNFNRKRDKFYVNANMYKSLIPINIRNIREIITIVKEYELLEYRNKGWAKLADRKFTEQGIPKGLRNFYSMTDETAKFIKAYEDVFKIEYDMSDLGFENITSDNKNDESLIRLKRYFIDELRTHHGRFEKKTAVKKTEKEIFESEEVQEVIKENENLALEKMYFIESGNLRATNKICNVAKEKRNDYLCELFGADENGKAKCIEFDRSSSIYTLEYDLNHNVDRASNFDFYQLLEFSVLDKLKSTELDIADYTKFDDAKFSYGALRGAYKLLPMPLYMRGKTIVYSATKMMIIEEKIQEVLDDNVDTYVRYGTNRVAHLINVNNHRAKNNFKIKDHDYELYTALSQILDAYGLAHTMTNYKFLFATAYSTIQDNLGHNKRKKHIFFFESLVMIFTQNYLYKSGVEKVVLLYDALFTSNDVDLNLVVSCMDKALVKVKEIVKNYSDNKYKNRKKKPNEIEMQELEEDELVLRFKEFIKDKEIEKREPMLFNDYAYFNFFRAHNANSSNDKRVWDTLRALGYDVM